MNNLKYYIFIAYMIVSVNSFAEKEITINRKVGTVSICVHTTSFYYEEINKALILGNLFDKYLKEKNFKLDVYFDFVQLKSAIDSKYFISYNQGDKLINDIQCIKYNTKGLVISIESKFLNTCELIKLFYWSVSNLENIETEQKFIDHLTNYKIESIEHLKIERILGTDFNSEEYNKLLNYKIFPKSKQIENLSYYFWNNKYLFYGQTKNDVLFTLPNIYNIVDLDKDQKVIFDSDSSFYYFSTKDKTIGHRQIMPYSNKQLDLYKTVGADSIIYFLVNYKDFYIVYQYCIQKAKLSILEKENIKNDLISKFSNFKYKRKNCIRF